MLKTTALYRIHSNLILHPTIMVASLQIITTVAINPSRINNITVHPVIIQFRDQVVQILTKAIKWIIIWEEVQFSYTIMDNTKEIRTLFREISIMCWEIMGTCKILNMLLSREITPYIWIQVLTFLKKPIIAIRIDKVRQINRIILNQTLTINQQLHLCSIICFKL